MTPVRFQATGMCGRRPASARIIWRRSSGSRTTESEQRSYDYGGSRRRRKYFTAAERFRTSTSLRAAICGATLRRMARPTTTSASTSRRHFALQHSVAESRSWARCSPGPNARADAIAPGERLPECGAAASISGHGPFRSSPVTWPQARVGEPARPKRRISIS